MMGRLGLGRTATVVAGLVKETRSPVAGLVTLGKCRATASPCGLTFM